MGIVETLLILLGIYAVIVAMRQNRNDSAPRRPSWRDYDYRMTDEERDSWICADFTRELDRYHQEQR